jgi:membrane protease YdiL (CAAX protease family)
MVVVGAPIAEELTFRGLLWSGLAKRGVRPWVAVLVSAAAFALIHFEPERLFVLLVIGSVLGAVRWITGSVGACIVAHAVNNAPGAIGILALGLAG